MSRQLMAPSASSVKVMSSNAPATLPMRTTTSKWSSRVPRSDCAAGTHAGVATSDLQEMHNHFRELIDAGMKSLAEKSGKDGLPAAPDTSTKAGEVPAPAPDGNVDSELQQQQKDADQTEAEVPQQDSGGE